MLFVAAWRPPYASVHAGMSPLYQQPLSGILVPRDYNPHILRTVSKRGNIPSLAQDRSCDTTQVLAVLSALRAAWRHDMFGGAAWGLGLGVLATSLREPRCGKGLKGAPN